MTRTISPGIGNIPEVTSQEMEGHSFMVIDTACQRAIHGDHWQARHLEVTKALEIPVHVISEQESFRFGDTQESTSSERLCSPGVIGNQWFRFRSSHVPGEKCERLPLLESDQGLADAGMVLDMFGGCVHFVALQAFGIKLRKGYGDHLVVCITDGDGDARRRWQ